MKAILFVLMLAPTLVFAQQKQVLTPQEFKTKLNDKSAILIDVRTPEEYKEGHLQNAVNKNLHDKDFDTYCTALDKNKVYFVYCLAGKRSHTAAVDMRKKGLTVFELNGGIENWQEAKLPVVK